MADDKEKPAESPIGAAMTILGILAVLVVLWFLNGGPSKADLRGLFLAPPAPIGSGDAYGPQVGEPAPWAPQE